MGSEVLIWRPFRFHAVGRGKTDIQHPPWPRPSLGTQARQEPSEIRRLAIRERHCHDKRLRSALTRRSPPPWWIPRAGRDAINRSPDAWQEGTIAYRWRAVWWDWHPVSERCRRSPTRRRGAAV